MGITGPALPDLALQTGSTIPQATNIIIWRSFTYIFGSLIAAVFLDLLHVDGYLMNGVCMILQGVILTASAWTTNLVLMTTLNSVSNFFCTMLTAGMEVKRCLHAILTVCDSIFSFN